MIKLGKLIEDVNPLRNHILQLCKTNGIRIKYTKNPNNISHEIGKKLIQIFPINGVISYSAALHEIGHVLKNVNDDPFDFDNEIEAWKWAKYNALTWNSKMQKSMVKSLYTHLPGGPSDAGGEDNTDIQAIKSL